MLSSELTTGDRVLVDFVSKEGQHWCKIVGFGGTATSEEIEVHLVIDDVSSSLSRYAPLTASMDEIIEHIPAPRDLYEDAIDALKKAKKVVKALQKSLPKESGERYYLDRTKMYLRRNIIDVGLVKKLQKE